MKILENLRSATPLGWACAALITTKASQLAIALFFRAPHRMKLLTGRVEQLLGSHALLSWGPSVVASLATFIAARLLSVKPILFTSDIKGKLSYKPSHQAVDDEISHDRRLTFRQIWDLPGDGHQAFISSNFPKSDPAAHSIFCDAYGYAENDQVQIAAIADGGQGPIAQRAARAMVDGFFEVDLSSYKRVAAEEIVMNAAQNARKEIEQKHTESDETRFYGEPTFLGGMVFTAADGKRYFAGVNCGDCKLYRLTKGKFSEVTKPSRLEAESSDGRFGAHRKAEYTFTIEVQAGDRLLFMTDGVHDNLDKNPPEKGIKEALGLADQRKLSTLTSFTPDNVLGTRIMGHVLDYTTKYVTALAKGEDLKHSSRKEYPGKLDHMALLIVDIR